jgi:hypothetical protein
MPTNRLSAHTVCSWADSSSEVGLLIWHVQQRTAVLAEALEHIAKRSLRQASPLVLAKLQSSEPIVRAAAIEGLAQLQVTEANDSLRDFLEDKDPRVRLAAVSATGRLQIQSARDSLLKIAQGAEADLRRASLDALRLLKEPRAVTLAVAALNDRDTQVAALRCLGELGGPSQIKAVLELGLRDPSAEVLPQIVHFLTTWSDGLPRAEQQTFDNAIAELQGASGALQRWKVKGPLSTAAAERTYLASCLLADRRGLDGAMQDWQIIFAAGADHECLWLQAKAETPCGWPAPISTHPSPPGAVPCLEPREVRHLLNGQTSFNGIKPSLLA